MKVQTKSAEIPLIFDMMSPRGHVRLNKFYLANAFSTAAYFFVSEDLSEEYRGFKAYPLGAKPCGSSPYERLALSFRVLRIIRKKQARDVVFLSYDLATFPLISNFLEKMAVNVTCFEHNTAPNSQLRALFHRLSAKSVRRFVYTPYLEEFYHSLGIRAEYVPHPCLPCEVDPGGSHEWTSIVSKSFRRYRKTAFCPSGSVTIAQMKGIARLYPDVLFVMKANQVSCLPNLLTAPYFEYFGNAMEQCDFVVIPFGSDYKVSGPAFEAIAMGKPVLALNNLFGRYMKFHFPHHIFFAGESIPAVIPKIDIDKYNHDILRAFGEAKCQ
jgi:hypothetical protein